MIEIMIFRAMILEDSQHWYADDGLLSKTICELTDSDIKFDPNDCCACDEAKYNVFKLKLTSKYIF